MTLDNVNLATVEMMWRREVEAAILPYLTVGYPGADQTVPLALEDRASEAARRP